MQLLPITAIHGAEIHIAAGTVAAGTRQRPIVSHLPVPVNNRTPDNSSAPDGHRKSNQALRMGAQLGRMNALANLRTGFQGYYNRQTSLAQEANR